MSVPLAVTESAVAVAVPNAEAILGALADAVLVIDGDDCLLYANPAAEQFFGAGASHLQSRDLGDLVQRDSPLLALAAKARDGASAVTEYNVDVLSPHSEARAVDVQMAAMIDHPGWVMVSLRERSIAHKLDRQLTHLGAGRSVAGLAAALAHEVKNPLAGIRGAAQLLERDVDGEGRELTRLITDETDRICKLVDRMEVFSDDHPMERTPVNIHRVLDHVRRAAASGFARHVRFVENYDPSLPPIMGDHDQLVQVFLNLLKNAAEAVPDEGGEIVLGTAFQPGLRLAAPGGEGRLRLPLVATVQDNGGGIPADLRASLFEPFITSKTSGTGLGLPLVAKIIGDHGGAVEFISEPGRTVFSVMLPFHHEARR
jgi:two-component system nitrogen regulation sensor histidine kinase GlnL